jgi:protein TonB
MLTVQNRKKKADARHRQLEAMVRLSHEAMSPMETPSDNARVEDGDYDSWDEMVFEHRNRDYGAYVVRKGYSNNVMIAVAGALLVVGLVILWPTFQKWLGGNERPVQPPPRKLVYTELSAPPPIDKPKPPPPQVQIPRLQRVIKFVPPKVVKEQVLDVIPSIEEIKVNDIAAEQVDGPAEVVFDEPVAEVIEEEDELFTVVDQQPEYAGGYDAMIAFIKANMQYPANARKMRIEGTVHVSFIVSKTGAISDVKVLRGIMTECDREAVRVVEMMPAWKPGKQNGRPVNVRFILPLKFRLS